MTATVIVVAAAVGAAATTAISQTINFVYHFQIKFDPSLDPIHIIRY